MSPLAREDTWIAVALSLFGSLCLSLTAFVNLTVGLGVAIGLPAFFIVCLVRMMKVEDQEDSDPIGAIPIAFLVGVAIVQSLANVAIVGVMLIAPAPVALAIILPVLLRGGRLLTHDRLDLLWLSGTIVSVIAWVVASLAGQSKLGADALLLCSLVTFGMWFVTTGNRREDTLRQLA